MASLVMEPTEWTNPSKTYALFLKQQWLQFEIKTLSQHSSFPFRSCKQFIDFLHKASVDAKVNMEKFYMYNLILTHMIF